MPLQTFLNLPKEKQEKIIDAAKKEFTDNSFYDASINKIIKEAGISRGSFYMYFENKEDLFVHLMDDYREKMIAEIIRNTKEEDADLFNVALAVFDYITDLSLENKENCFLNKTLTMIDANLLNHFIKIKDSNKEIEMMKKYSIGDKFNINSDEELIFIGDLIMSAMVIEIMFVFNGKYDVEQSRKRIERKFEMIKYGILK